MIGVMSARCLSIHAGYRCRHSGACCSGVFPIPVEPHLVELARHGRGGDVLATGPDGACVFFGREDRLCALQRRGGEAALPTACRHFPRVFLRDDRGLTLGLSHYCPTAARLLLEDVPLEIVEAGPPLALDGEVEAFEAAGALPPLLRPDVLTDLDGFDAWERAAIHVLGRTDATADECLGAIGAATETIRTWSPGGASLTAAVEEAFHAAAERHLPARDGATRARDDGPVKRYLAAKLFGHRLAYECRGLRTMVEWVRLCLARVRDEMTKAPFIDAVRAADLALVHRTDTAALARSLARIEQQP